MKQAATTSLPSYLYHQRPVW